MQQQVHYFRQLVPEFAKLWDGHLEFVEQVHINPHENKNRQTPEDVGG
jgi:hypothetical protein